MRKKHTPGPWDCTFTITQNGRRIDITAEDGSNVAQALAGDHVACDATARANARLIAASPAMLEALRTTAGNIRSLGPAGAIEPFTPYLEWLRLIEETIALATGEEA